MGRSKYSKSQLFLMEFIAVVLFFSICISICISAFVRANTISEDSLRLNRAITLAQTTAEDIKAGEYMPSDDISTFYNSDFFVRITSIKEDDLLKARIQVYNKNDVRNQVFQIEVFKYMPSEV